MASPRDQNTSADGGVIVPPTYYRPTTEVGVPANAASTSSHRGHYRSPEGAAAACHVPGTHRPPVHNNGSDTQGTHRTAVRNVNQMANTRGTLAHNGGNVSSTQTGTAESRSRAAGTQRQPAFNRTPATQGTQVQDGRNPERLRSIPEQEYPTMADRLLALRASRRTANCQTPSTVHSLAGHNSVVTSHQGDTASRQVINTSHGDRPMNGTIRRPERTKFAIKIFTTAACLVGLLLMVISIAFLTRSTASNVLHDVGVVLAVISTVLLVAAILVYLFHRLGVCVQPVDQLRRIEVRSAEVNTSTKPIQKAPEPRIFRPEPAPGYHTPLPFGPVTPGYIPPQIIYSQYAKKSFNHREILSGIRDTDNNGSLDDLPSEFRAFSMKTPRDGSTESPVAGPSMGFDTDLRQREL